jgi:hypothetical protein
MSQTPIIIYHVRDTLAEVKRDNPAFYACLTSPTPSAVCDEIVGSIFVDSGACSTARYRDQDYCACVNSVPDAPCYFKPCAEETAYRTVSQTKELKNHLCPQIISCINIEEVGGKDNIVTHDSQTQYCGTTVLNVSAAAIIFILLVVFIALRWNEAKRGTSGRSGTGSVTPTSPTT